MPKLIRITTAPLSLKYLLPGQMSYMREHGMEVLMVSSDGRELADVIHREQCRHVVIPMTRSITPWKDLRALWALVRLFRSERPDIVHSHTPKAGLLAMTAARMAGVRVRIYTVAGLRFMTATGNLRRVLVFMEKLTFRAASHVWPNSDSIYRYILKNRMAAASKLEVIGGGSSNGIDLHRYQPSALDPMILADTAASFQHQPELFYFLAVGRIVQDKGIDELVKAFTGVHEKYPNARLLLVGELEDQLDPISDEARRIIAEHPGIIRTGWSDRVECFLQLADVLVHASHREGFPNVLLQAGAMRCPVICSAIEGNIDIVDHDVTGLLFPVRDAASLAQCMLTVIGDPATLNRLSGALFEKVHQRFSREIILAAMLRRYHELLEVA